MLIECSRAFVEWDSPSSRYMTVVH